MPAKGQLPYAKQRLLQLFTDHEIKIRVDEYGTLFIDHPVLLIWITQRPGYCDRGRWQVNAESRDPSKIHIDAYDGFPRYYFHVENCVSEVVEFREVRLRNADKVAKSNKSPLRMWCVYEHPEDFPEHYVAKLFEGANATDSMVMSKDYEIVAESMFEMGLSKLMRMPDDDPTILETWL